MQQGMPPGALAEFADATFQAIITAGLAGFSIVLYRRVRQPWLAWWAAAWGLYVVRLLSIIAFLRSGNLVWLFWHQVITGWVALAILWAALVFSRQAKWRNRYLALAALPFLLAWVAVNGLDRFLLVAIPMVMLISGVTLWTSRVFWQHARETGSGGARFVSISFALWGLHHLDYPFLRARGAWEPWGYFLDIMFELAVGVGFGLMVLSDMAAKLRARTDDLARLQGRMVQQYEADRRRLSRELHDEAAQTLSAVKLEVGMLQEKAAPQVAERLDHVLNLVDGGIRGIRRVINDLRPALLDDLGLVAAIRQLAEEFGARTGLAVTLDLRDDLPRLQQEAELALFRAAQETLTNVVRHADASGVTIRLRRSDAGVLLEIADDGRGFPSSANLAALEQRGHLGIAGMRERIQALDGTVTIEGGTGTTIRISLPPRVEEERR